MPDSNWSLHKPIWAMVFAIVAILTYAIYAQGFDASWTFDDKRLLQHLAQVTDIDSAMVYLVQKKSISITDRPISMASFLLNVSDWPNNRAGFRQVNVLLHILNALLVALVASRIARLTPSLNPHRYGFAVSLAAVWMLHPLFASTSFHIIQRMVLLAATFSLIGIAMYLRGRDQLAHGNRNGYAWMSAGMLVGAGLGTLAKENAALTPLLVAVLEYSILSRLAPISDRHLARWRLLFFVLPAVALVGYMLYYLLASVPDSYLLRPFTLEQRILSEAVILFEYLRQLLVPDVSMMGPFQDDTWRIRGSDAVSWLAVIAWLASISAAVVWRHRFPLFSFGVLFFLAGHLLESGILPLELFFEHRNYLPGLGPLGAIIAFAWTRYSKLPRYSSLGFAALMALLLLHTSSLWGDPGKSAVAWYQNHPTSTRAAQQLATLHQTAGDHDTAAAIIIRAYKNNPRDGALALNAVISMCFDTPTTKANASVPQQVAADAPNLHTSPVILKTLHSQISLFAQGKCTSFEAKNTIAIAQGLLENPAFQTPIKQYGLLMAIARATEAQGRIQDAIAIKITAFRTVPSIMLARSIFFSLIKIGNKDAASSFLSEARRLAPQYMMQYDEWDKTLKTDI